MSEPSSGQIVSSHLLKLVLGVVSLTALAMLACNGSDGGSVSSPAAPPGMFSTLPTSEPPVLGDQPPTVELNTPEPNLNAAANSHAQSYLHARANAHATAYGHPHAQSDRYTSSDGHAQPDRHTRPTRRPTPNPTGTADAQPDGHSHADGHSYTDSHC